MKQNQQAKMCARQMRQKCLAMRVRLINRIISRIYDDVLRPHGIKGSQMSILAAISASGRPGPSEICRMLHLDVSTLSRNVSRMKKKGWLKISPVKDRRAHVLHLTDAGNRMIVDAYSSWQVAQERVEKIIGADNTTAISKFRAPDLRRITS
jgi:DNA-binding MarR family transcriptional regulator